jgi:hypothetical protein
MDIGRQQPRHQVGLVDKSQILALQPAVDKIRQGPVDQQRLSKRHQTIRRDGTIGQSGICEG